jgi:hypothetical protein
MNDRLKKIIFDKLYMNLSKAEVIERKGNIWFIDREEKYWYLVYENSGTLRFRYKFFTDFFHLFSMSPNEFEPIIIEWVEEVLNRKVKKISVGYPGIGILSKEVLNSDNNN